MIATLTTAPQAPVWTLRRSAPEVPADCLPDCSCDQCRKARIEAENPDAPRRRGWCNLSPAVEARKRKHGLCLRYGCLNRHGSHKIYCAKHHHQAQQERDPIGFLFWKRRRRAIERGFEWTITIENFREWCLHFRYHEKCGRGVRGVSIDRKDALQGYHIWNIRQLRFPENSRKGATEDKKAHQAQRQATSTWSAPVDDTCPF